MLPDSPAIFSTAAPPVSTGISISHGLKSWAPRLMLGLTAGMLWCGCHKKSEATVPPRETAAAAATTAAPGALAAQGPVAQPLPATSQTIAANATADEVAGQLTLELRRYIAYTRRIPQNFEDFAAHDPIKFPPPPTGKKYVISGGRVVLQ